MPAQLSWHVQISDLIAQSFFMQPEYLDYNSSNMGSKIVGDTWPQVVNTGFEGQVKDKGQCHVI